MNGQYSGRVVIIEPGVALYVGHFEEHQKHGSFFSIAHDGTREFGQFKHGLVEGEWVYIFLNGDVRTEKWRENKKLNENWH